MLSNLFLALFLALLSLQLGLYVEMTVVTLIGCGLSVLGGLKLFAVERPTWGLVFVMVASVGFVGSELLEDWAVEGSWVQTSSLYAAFLLAIGVYLLWLFAASRSSNAQAPLERDTQIILVMGLVLLLLIPPPQATVVSLLGIPIATLSIAGMLLASMVLLADRCAGVLMSRLLLMLPLFLVVPVMLVLLGTVQGPVVAALGSIFPDSGGYSNIGFSPYQRLDASVFLRPSTSPVMRIEAAALPSRYLAGNRLVRLDANMVWQPPLQPRLFLSNFDAQSLPTGELRYPIDNHHAVAVNGAVQNLTIHSLKRDGYIFLSPGTHRVTGAFSALSKDAAGVWTPAYERGADRRWRLETGGDSVPQTLNAENLQLPEFWDQSLQEKSEEFLGSGRAQTVGNVLEHFRGRGYSLQTNFDSTQPFHDFFLNEKAGYCFWFASATTLALRANGIPSRLVSGYMVHERLSSQLWLVRERDAHSWVEWQDDSGYWHTVDPTPISINAFFGGYDSFELSTWYHYLAGQWQIMIDRILADELAANVVRYGGLLVLLFLFVREYRRVAGKKTGTDGKHRQWQKLWQRFLSNSKLPANNSWTASTYAENLPASWPAASVLAVKEFLRSYNLHRFSGDDERAIRDVESALEKCLRVISRPNSKARSS
ncbi:MAG: transglutaminase domain-containing protein [Proteobacteria bacterium]|nr:transglutaminase domain-containing protein [Pseudomonadota bacterium]